MKKIISFVIGQFSLILAILGTIGFFYMLFDLSNNTQNASVYYEEFAIDNYQIVVDLNTGMIDKSEILKIDINNLSTNQTYFKFDSIWPISLVASVIFTIILDLVYWGISIINAIIGFFRYLKCKKILKENYDLKEERLYELPSYEPIVANAIYRKKHQYEMIMARLEYYYKEKGILDKNNRFKEDFDINALSELEKIIIKKYQKDKSEIKKLTSQQQDAEYYKNRKEFKNKINEVLKEKRYYEEDIVKVKVKNFFEIIDKVKKNKEYFFKSDEVLKNLLILIALVIVISFFKVAVLVLIVLGIWILVKYNGITLTEEGKMERAKIIFLIKQLKKKKTVSEEEKYFLTMLTKY